MQKYDLIVKSEILTSEKPTKPMEGVLSDNPNKPNKLNAYLLDGTKIKVAQRSGKGGFDFNKFLSGKIFAVAADGFSKVMEKGEDKKPTKIQKTEDGLPLYSSSGFYLLSSKEYPSLKMYYAYCTLIENGEKALLIQESAKVLTAEANSELDWDFIESELESMLSDDHNYLNDYTDAVNKKRKRDLDRAKEEAEDNGESFEGPEYADLKPSTKDGNPFLMLILKDSTGKVLVTSLIQRELKEIDDEGRLVVKYVSPLEALASFKSSQDYKKLSASFKNGCTLNAVQGNMLRTSVSFKTKCKNFVENKISKDYGDGTFLKGAFNGWVKSICTLIYSKHPKFPTQDYNQLNYVVACRQAEIGMNKLENNTYTTPCALQYDESDLLTLLSKNK